jgi:hypothetical protein
VAISREKQKPETRIKETKLKKNENKVLKKSRIFFYCEIIINRGVLLLFNVGLSTIKQTNKHIFKIAPMQL